MRVVEIDGFSRELCGGTHVRSTAEIGAVRDPHRGLGRLAARAGSRRSPRARRGRTCTARARELDDVRAELEQARREAKKPKAAERRVDVEPEIVVVGGDANVIVMEIEGFGARRAARPLRPLQAAARARRGRARLARGRHVATSSRTSTRPSPRSVSAGDVVKEIAPIVGGGGGGRPTMARAGGKDPEKLPDALAEARAS